MELSKLTIIDVIQMPKFENNITCIIKEIRDARKKLEMQNPYASFKRGPIDRLREKGVFGPQALAALYAKVLDKTVDTSEYPSALRTLIKDIGDEALHRTVQELRKEEDEQRAAKEQDKESAETAE